VYHDFILSATREAHQGWAMVVVVEVVVVVAAAAATPVAARWADSICSSLVGRSLGSLGRLIIPPCLSLFLSLFSVLLSREQAPERDRDEEEEEEEESLLYHIYRDSASFNRWKRLPDGSENVQLGNNGRGGEWKKGKD